LMRRLLLLALLSPLVAVIGRGLTAEADRKPPFYADKANLLVYLDGAGRPVPVKSADEWARRRGHVLANMQLVMGPLPPLARRVPLDLKVEAEETLARVIRKKVTFAVEKDDRLTAYLLMPRGLKGRAPALLCLHQTTAIGKGEPAGAAGRANLHYALELAERGYVTLPLFELADDAGGMGALKRLVDRLAPLERA